MIYYLTAARSAGAMGLFLQTWGKSLAGRLQILPYEQIFSGAPITLRRGTYIFATVRQALGSDSPPSRERTMVAQLHHAIAQRYGPRSVLNDPLLSMRRFSMLRMLRQRGINRFAAYQAGELPRSVRFPVFLREDHGTKNDQTPLLHNREEYRAALALEPPRPGLLAIEFLDTADEAGIYRKYGAFIVGERIVPRHLFFSRQWMVKSADLCAPQQLVEELAYLECNPHAEALLEVCRLANISYGRVDYAMRQGRVQVWEINTTPAVIHPAGVHDTVRARAHERFTELFSAALDELESATA